MDQITYLRKMTGEQRLKQALHLSDFLRAIVKVHIKKLYPQASKEQLKWLLLERLWGKDVSDRIKNKRHNIKDASNQLIS